MKNQEKERPLENIKMTKKSGNKWPKKQQEISIKKKKKKGKNAKNKNREKICEK